MSFSIVITQAPTLLGRQSICVRGTELSDTLIGGDFTTELGAHLMQAASEWLNSQPCKHAKSQISTLDMSHGKEYQCAKACDTTPKKTATC